MIRHPRLKARRLFMEPLVDKDTVNEGERCYNTDGDADVAQSPTAESRTRAVRHHRLHPAVHGAHAEREHGPGNVQWQYLRLLQQHDTSRERNNDLCLTTITNT